MRDGTMIRLCTNGQCNLMRPPNSKMVNGMYASRHGFASEID